MECRSLYVDLKDMAIYVADDEEWFFRYRECSEIFLLRGGRQFCSLETEIPGGPGYFVAFFTAVNYFDR